METLLPSCIWVRRLARRVSLVLSSTFTSCTLSQKGCAVSAAAWRFLADIRTRSPDRGIRTGGADGKQGKRAAPALGSVLSKTGVRAATQAGKGGCKKSSRLLL